MAWTSRSDSSLRADRWLTVIAAGLCVVAPCARASPGPPPNSTAASAINSAKQLSAEQLRARRALLDGNDAGLTPLYKALSRLERGKRRRVRISHWGDSHVAADAMTGQLRRRFQRRFGDAGPGFVHLARPWRSYRHEAASTGAAGGWRAERLWSRYSRSRPRPRDRLFGVAGVSVHARPSRGSPPATAWIAPKRRRLSAVEFFFLRQPGGGWFDVRYGERTMRRALTVASTRRAGYLRIALGAADELGARQRVTLVAAGGEVRLFGADLSRASGGVVYDAFGINGARLGAHLEQDAALFTAHTRRLDPQLVVLAYGSNEVDKTSLDPPSYRRQLRRVLRRMRRAMPKAGCLIVGPPDQARYSRDVRGYQLPPRLEMIIGLQRRAARSNRCAFWDQRAAMGGPGTIFRWRSARPPLARRDHVHFTVAAYRRIAEHLFDAISARYQAYKLRLAAQNKRARKSTRRVRALAAE